MSTQKLSELKTFSDRLNFLRGNKSKAHFAKEIGISPPLFSQWEKGAVPTYDKVRLISERVGRTPDWLLTGINKAGTSLTYTMRERLYEAKGATGLRVPQLADRMGVDVKEVERIMNEGGEPDGAFLSAFEQHLQPEIDRIKSTPCAGCRSKDAEISFLRSQLSESLARIPKPKDS